jgi:hypothetical protein
MEFSLFTAHCSCEQQPSQFPGAARRHARAVRKIPPGFDAGVKVWCHRTGLGTLVPLIYIALRRTVT